MGSDEEFKARVVWPPGVQGFKPASEDFLRRVLGNLFTFVEVLQLDGVACEANEAPLAKRAAREAKSTARNVGEKTRVSGEEEKIVRVLLVDDHDIVRQGYTMILRARGGVEVVGEAANGYEAISLADQLHPDVVVMDVSMPKMDGIEATKKIKQQHPEVQVVGLSMHEAEDMAAEMLHAGASSYLCKDDAANKLYDAILSAAGGADD